MLSNSFLHISGVGPRTERHIWERGIYTWEQFLQDPSAAALSHRITGRIAQALTLSVASLERDDHRFFASCLPRREHWRAFPEFSHRIAYLDIETTSLDGDDITIIGLYDGREMRIYQKGEDLEAFVEDIEHYSLLVTFFGNCFDLPFLRRRFPGIDFHQLHVDLCPALRRLGLKGGLKNIEHILGIPRDPETERLDGWDAVRLWREWERGSQEALDLLKRYNKEDVMNMETLMKYAYPRLREMSRLEG